MVKSVESEAAQAELNPDAATYCGNSFILSGLSVFSKIVATYMVVDMIKSIKVSKVLRVVPGILQRLYECYLSFFFLKVF